MGNLFLGKHFCQSERNIREQVFETHKAACSHGPVTALSHRCAVSARDLPLCSMCVEPLDLSCLPCLLPLRS